MARNPTRPFQVKLSNEGESVVEELATQTGQSASDIVREALRVYFLARGKDVDFSPGRIGVRKDSGKK